MGDIRKINKKMQILFFFINISCWISINAKDRIKQFTHVLMSLDGTHSIKTIYLPYC